MILPDGCSDVLPGKIATVVTHLEMAARPGLPPDAKGADIKGEWPYRDAPISAAAGRGC